MSSEFSVRLKRDAASTVDIKKIQQRWPWGFVEDPIPDLAKDLAALQQNEIEGLAATLSDGLGNVSSKFVRDMLVVGTHRSRSVNLTGIAGALGEGIEMHASHKRLSRNLALLGDHIRDFLLQDSNTG